VTEAEAMARALDLAWSGWGRVHPNPLVGAVVLRGGEPVGEGSHAEFGGAHAELAALAQAGPRARGATMVVTLEPCRHHGKQPPCVDAIIASGIRRVVFGASDPNPAAGGGAAELAAAGLDVAVLPGSRAVEDQNASFFHEFRHQARPFVALKLATSLDGRIADYTGRSRWISGPEARDWVHWLRSGFEAIAVGGRTARIDNPSLTVRGSLTPRLAPRRVVFDRRAELSGARHLLDSARQIPVLVVAEGPVEAERAKALTAAGVELVASADLRDGMARLRAAGLRSVLVEGGGRLAGRLVAQGLVDRFYWVQSPVWLGDDGIPAFGGIPGALLEQAVRWRVVERRALGQDTVLVLGSDRST
jgi:diaminohydroxyphosphoribosylaminopyrimidine deaminase/5-amino-6-(5-phosphoribosylamino)uracil reductase